MSSPETPGSPVALATQDTQDTQDTPAEGARWRGVAAEGAVDVDTAGGLFLRERSRRLLGELARPHKRALWLVALAVVAQNAAGLAGPFLIAVGIDRGIPAMVERDDPTVLITVAGLLFASALVQGLLRWYFFLRSGRIGQDMLITLRRRVFGHLQGLSLSFHERYTSGRVISRLTSDVTAISELLDEGLEELIMAVLSIVSIAAVLLLLDAPLAIVVLASFPLLAVLFVWFRQHSTVRYRATRESVALLIVQFAESLGGIRAVQAFRREGRNQQIFERIDQDYKIANRRTWQLTAIFEPAIMLLGNLATGVVLLYGGWRVIQGDLEVGVLVAFLLYLRQFFAPMEDLSVFYNSFQSAIAGLEKLSGVLEERPGVPAPEHPTPLPAAHGLIGFDGVRFGYRGSDGDSVVLPALDLVVPAGQTVALVGATGAGKSTLARLLARFYDPQEGAVTLDGVDLRQLTDRDLRRAVTMVTQESFLFGGTVAENIAFGDPGADRDRIVAAATAIGAHEFISALPEGYDTDVRKRGGRLSAGQKQLVAFARAFLADPAVLILDEATSSLDAPSERMVQRALRTILTDRTALIIAHRLSTVEIADRVLVMDAGRIVEDGSPNDLVAGRGEFAALHRSWRDSLV
ncbi:MAG: ABC transporter ATP-binding protein [Geodermatophilaceae bacterium]|nr:ABC transporter ATP-binding protein [Geodermatophilaceae bacterium]